MAVGVSYWVYMQPRNALGVTQSLVYGTEDFTVGTGGPALPGARFAGTFVPGPLKHPGVMRFDLCGGGRAFGAGQANTGAFVFENTDGALDSWRDLNFEGTYAEQYLVPEGKTPGENNASWLQITGFLGQPEFTESEVTIPIRDFASRLDIPVQTRLYGGTNVLPDGLDGTADDIKGQPIPISAGIVRDGTAVCVNTVRYIFQVNDKAFVDYVAGGIYWSLTPKDKLVAIPPGISRTLAEFAAGATAYAVTAVDAALNQVTLAGAIAGGTGTPVHVTSAGTMPGGLSQEAYYYVRALGGNVYTLHLSAADAGTGAGVVDITSAGAGAIYLSTNQTPYGLHDWCNDATGVFFRCGSKPEGTVTFDAISPVSWGGLAMTVVLQDLLTRRTPAELQYLSFYGPDPAVANKDVGFYITEETTLRELINRCGDSYGAGLVDGMQLYTPGDPVVSEGLPAYMVAQPNVTLSEDKIYSIEVDNTDDEWGESVVWQVVYKYRRNWTVQRRSEVPGASEADIAFAEQEWRTVVVEDAAVKTQYPKARTLTVYSVFDDPATAAALAADLLARFKVRRRLFKVSAPLSLDPLYPNSIHVSYAVILKYPRFGMDAGHWTTVLGMQKNYDKDTWDLVLWR